MCLVLCWLPSYCCCYCLMATPSATTFFLLRSELIISSVSYVPCCFSLFHKFLSPFLCIFFPWGTCNHSICLCGLRFRVLVSLSTRSSTARWLLKKIHPVRNSRNEQKGGKKMEFFFQVSTKGLRSELTCTFSARKVKCVVPLPPSRDRATCHTMRAEEGRGHRRGSGDKSTVLSLFWFSSQMKGLCFP